MDLALNNKIILVTGSSKGIGFGIAKSFLEEGSTVIINGRDEKNINRAEKKLINKFNSKRVYKFLGDINTKSVLSNLYQFIEKKFQKLDHLVCNVGNGQSVSLLQENDSEFKRMLDINLMTAVNCVTKFIPMIQPSLKNEDFPSITFVSSICGVEAIGCPIAYASAKAALISYSKNLSFPLGKKGIRVNSVSPGNIMFEGSTWDGKMKIDPIKTNQIIENNVPLRCFGSIKDIGNAVIFLASKRAKFINGANLIIDGGQTRT